ncbi:MAG: GNAT family N-acetyltransferase [Bacteroidales bacterium]|jgi:ribosomal-protein-alanine N-acetyltransferase|nr:GNAT family N-acetyltransferase [Bacteroidales bacterium]
MIIRQAGKEDRDEILRIMEYWNMHHVPSEEMPELDISCFFIAEENGKIVGASGYKMISPEVGKTTLLGVDPEEAGKGIGMALQQARLKKMHELGAKKVITNADRPDTIAWYKKHFGYYEVGKLKKIHSFGRDDIDEWTTIEMNLDKYYE